MPSPRRLLSDLSVKIRSVLITQAPGLLARGLSRFSADSFDCDFTPLLDGVPAVAGDRHVLGEVPERDAGPLLGRLHSGHLRPHHHGGPEGGGESYGKVPANALRKVGTARMRRRRVRASFLPRMGQGIGCVWTLLVDVSCRNSECKMNAAISFEQGLTISPAVLRQGDDARKLRKSKSKRCFWIQNTDFPLNSPQALHSITLVTRANQPDAIAFNGLQIRLRGQAVCNDGI